MTPVPDLEILWRQTLGDPRIGVAILDGPVDVAHPSLANARVELLPGVVAPVVDGGWASQHGTHVASLVFGQHDGPVRGIAPGCRGLLLPIFASRNDNSLRPCSQLDLARAIVQAVAAGTHVINISGGEFTPGGQAHPILADVVRECGRQGVLIVAAAGNDGCACLHVPAALDSVLAVGAMDSRGEPLPLSNWGGAYQDQGIVAPGYELTGAMSGGGTTQLTGTSGATALASGIVALLLSLQLRRGLRPDVRVIRQALLQSAVDCRTRLAWDCPRLLVGRLNLSGAIELLFKDHTPMSLTTETSFAQPVAPVAMPTEQRFGVAASAVEPSACGCKTPIVQKVYALGLLGHDLISETRLDAMAQKMAADRKMPVDRAAPQDSRRLYEHLQQHPTDAATVEWILILDGTPIYAIRPQGPFAAEGYQELREFLRSQLDDGVERISVPGVIAGSTNLLSGQTVPVLVPELRGMFSWSTKELIESAIGNGPPSGSDADAIKAHEKRSLGIGNFLDKVYYGMRNLGVLPQDRALNFAATNAYNFDTIYEEAIQERMELESVNVIRSPFCRAGADCWDVEVYFFYPERQLQTVRRVYRFTVDVSDIVPVTVGPTRKWFTR